MRLYALAIAPSHVSRRTTPTIPSSTAVSRYSECASWTLSPILRFSSHSCWNPCAPVPLSGLSAKPRSATFQ